MTDIQLSLFLVNTFDMLDRDSGDFSIDQYFY